jgi:SAM-dependent methyltransferase
MFNWDPRKVKNFVLADATHLPFKNDSFSGIYISHVMEHIPSPLLAIKEIKRVCCGSAFFRVPSQFYEDSNITHLFTWNPLTFRNLLKKHFDFVEVGYTRALHAGIDPKVAIINLLSRIFNIRSEIYAICRINKKQKN